MKKILKTMILIFIFSFEIIFSKDIYIGDKIGLNLKNISERDIKEAFKDFYIDSIKKTKDGYNVYFRTFKVGDNVIDLKNKKIIIKVKSSLEEKDKNIYMDLSDKSNKEVKKLYFPVLKILSGLIGFSILLFEFLKFFKRSKKRSGKISSEEKFKIKMNNLSVDNFDFEISEALRSYIDFKYGSNFLSGEYKKIGEIGEEDIKFIKSLDYYKFSKEKSKNMKQYKEEAFKIFNKLNGKGDKKNV